MKKFRDRYTDALWAPNSLRPNELLIALVYAKYAGAKDNGKPTPDDLSWVTWPTLSDATGIRSKDALNRAMKGLVDAGWLVPAEQRRQHRAPRYRLSIPTNPEVRFTYVSEPDADVCETDHCDPSEVRQTDSRGTRDDSQRYASRT